MQHREAYTRERGKTMPQTSLERAVRYVVAVLVMLSAFALVTCSGDDEESRDEEFRNVSVLLPVGAGAFLEQAQDQPIPFPNGSAFSAGIGNNAVTLTFNTTSTFTLASGSATASGTVAFGSCLFTVTASTFPAGRGPQVGDRLNFPTCNAVIGASNVEVGGGTVTGTAVLVLVNAAGVSAISDPGTVRVRIQKDGILVINDIPTDIRCSGLTHPC